MLWIDVKTHGMKKSTKENKGDRRRKKDRQKISFSSTSVLYVFHNNCSLNSSERARAWDDPTVCPLHRRQQLSHPGALAASTRTTPFTAVWLHFFTQSHTLHRHTLHRCVCISTFAAIFVCDARMRVRVRVCACVWESFRLEHIERERSTDTSLFLNKAKVEWKERSCSSIIRSPCCGG